MKNILLTLVSFLFLILVLSSCSDENDNPLITNDSIVGTWELESVIIDGAVIDVSEWGEYYVQRYLFESGGTGKSWLRFKGLPVRTDDLNWELIDNILKITINENVRSVIIGLNNNNLIFIEGNQDQTIYSKLD